MPFPMNTPFVRKSLLLAFAGLCVASFIPAIAASTAPEFKETSPVAVPRERQFDFTSGLNHLPYRLMISTPAMEPGKVYPVLYVLDGNWYFRATADAALWGSGPFEPAIVVGICYPVAGNPAADYPEVRRRRALEPRGRQVHHGGLGDHADEHRRDGEDGNGDGHRLDVPLGDALGRVHADDRWWRRAMVLHHPGESE